MAIQLGGGGSASQVNEVVFLKDTANVITLDDGRVYLKGGVYETDLSLYPDATTELVNAENFSFAANMTNAGVDAMCSDGTHLYLLNQYDNKVYKYTKTGTYVAQYSISAGNGALLAIEWDGTHFWLSSSNTYIYKYDASFNPDSSNPLYNLSSRTGSATIKGITWDGTHFYVLDYNRNVHKMNSDWSYASVVWGVSGSTNYVNGITSDGTHIYVYSGYQYLSVRKFSNTGTDLGIEFTANFGNSGVLAWDGANFRGADPSTTKVYKMADANGIESIVSSSASSQGNYSQYGEGQNYVRVK